MSAEAANNPPKIGLVQIDLSNPFHLGEVDGAKEAARRAGFQLIVTSGEGDVNKQIQAVEIFGFRLDTRQADEVERPTLDHRRRAESLAPDEIPITGLEHGLKQNWYVDERSDPEKATKAAAQYLKTLADMAV